MNMKQFAFVLDGQVFFKLALQDLQENERNQLIIAGLQSNPQVLEILDPNVNVGWYWDGSNFRETNNDNT